MFAYHCVQIKCEVQELYTMTYAKPMQITDNLHIDIWYEYVNDMQIAYNLHIHTCT